MTKNLDEFILQALRDNTPDEIDETARTLHAIAETKRRNSRRTAVFRHGIGIDRRTHGTNEMVVDFGATHIDLKLTVGKTSPFHQLPNGRGYYVEIGVDTMFAPPDLIHSLKKLGDEPRDSEGKLYGESITTREIVNRLIVNATANGSHEQYLQALRDVVHYDEQQDKILNRKES